MKPHVATFDDRDLEDLPLNHLVTSMSLPTHASCSKTSSDNLLTIALFVAPNTPPHHHTNPLKSASTCSNGSLRWICSCSCGLSSLVSWPFLSLLVSSCSWYLPLNRRKLEESRARTTTPHQGREYQHPVRQPPYIVQQRFVLLCFCASDPPLPCP